MLAGYFFAARLFGAEEARKAFIKFFVPLTTLIFCLIIVKAYVPLPFPLPKRLTMNGNTLGLYPVLAVPYIFFYCMWIWEERRFLKYFSAAACMVALFVSFSSGAWLAVLCMLPFIFCYAARAGKIKLRNIAFGLCLCLMALAALDQISVGAVRKRFDIEHKQILSLNDAGRLTNHRAAIWRIVSGIAADRPITGCGRANLLNAYREAIKNNKEFAKLDRYARSHAHNMYLELAVSSGIPSALLFAAALFMMLTKCWRGRARIENGVPWHMISFVLLLGQTVYGLTGDVFEARRDLAVIFWASMGIAAALPEFAEKERERRAARTQCAIIEAEALKLQTTGGRQMHKDGTIHTALAFCDPKGTYCRHAAVTAVSIFANTSGRVCLHIVHDDTLTDDNRGKLEQIASSYGQETDFINVEKLLDTDRVDASRLTLDGMRGTLFRLLLPDVVDADKVIYLDCDVVVNMDIAELWNAPLGGRALAAARDVWSLNYLKGRPLPWRLDKAWRMLGVKRGEYFNAGVLLLDLKKIREEYDFLEAVADFYAKYKKCITLADQDCLNHIFADDKTLVDERFNRIDAEGAAEENLRGSIWHMAGGAAKPWALCTRPYVDDLYWRYLRMTPYCRSENELIRLMLDGMSSSPYAHLHSSDCAKRIRRQIADNIFRGHIRTLPYIFMKKMFVRRK